ncbi:MAG: hypothetical protein K0S82_1271 [Gaiellaceae bacterium]|jgi:hypothetical protein|nr:hypothetical protein [Gaiellaceae bacterium]
MAIKADHARLIALCERLADATLAGAAEWRDESHDNFLWTRTEGKVSIGARDRDGQPPYELAIFNPEGEKVEELASALAEDDSPAAWNAPLAELYRVARRSALRADEIIDALLNALPKTGDRAPEPTLVRAPETVSR